MIMKKLKLLASKLEDPERPLLGPNIKHMRMSGLILPQGPIRRVIWLIVHFQLFIFAMTQNLELLLMLYRGEDVQNILNNVKYTIIGSVNVFKVSLFLAWQNDWITIFDYITTSDIKARKRKDSEDNKIINAYTSYCRKITYTFWAFTMFTVLAITLPTLIKYLVLISMHGLNGVDYTKLDFVVTQWVPFDRYSKIGYPVSNLYETYITFYAGFAMNAFDNNTVVLMVYFKGEIELLKRRCAEIFNEGKEDEIRLKIKECHDKHVDIVKHAALFNSCLSPVMFVYTVVTSATICASVFELTADISFSKKLATTQYAAFGVAQLFLYCWHGNDVLYMSRELMRGVYESSWWKYKKFRKEVILLTGQLDKEVYFTSGPFFNITVTSFISIIKGAYSFYTLVSQK